MVAEAAEAGLVALVKMVVDSRVVAIMAAEVLLEEMLKKSVESKEEVADSEAVAIRVVKDRCMQHLATVAQSTSREAEESKLAAGWVAAAETAAATKVAEGSAEEEELAMGSEVA